MSQRVTRGVKLLNGCWTSKNLILTAVHPAAYTRTITRGRTLAKSGLLPWASRQNSRSRPGKFAYSARDARRPPE